MHIRREKRGKDLLKEDEKDFKSGAAEKNWCYREKIFDKKSNKQTDKMMKIILTHANPEWGEKRSTGARVLDPKNQDRVKRSRAGVVHTNWDNLMMKWSGCQRWWRVSNDWTSCVKTAEKLCKRILKKEEDRKVKGFSLTGKKMNVVRLRRKK